MDLSGVELKLGARCLYKQILDQALKILFLSARKLTKIGTIFENAPRPPEVHLSPRAGQLEKKLINSGRPRDNTDFDMSPKKSI